MQLLDAVNACLRAISQSRVNSVDTTLPDVAQAVDKIGEITELILSAGWQCNSDTKFTLALDSNSKVPVPANALSVDIKEYNPGISFASIRVDPNDGVKRLWDNTNNTWVFSQPPQVDVIYLLPFDNLPSHFQRYIAARSAREFAVDKVGATNVDKMMTRREEEAFANLLDVETEVEGLNILEDNLHCVQIVDRFNYDHL